MSAAPTKFSDVTVAVTCYNHQSYIEQCLDSIEAQTWIPRQVIVIDDASKDDSAEVIRHWLQKHQSSWSLSTHVRNRGVCTTLNEALKLADSRFFCHVSGDDWEVADRFERQSTDAGWNDPSTALLVGDIREVGPGGATLVDHNFGGRLGHITGQAAQDQALSHLLVENVIPAPGVLLRTDLVRRLGGFDEDLAFEDYDMWLRLS
jgi:glycosyltransferase involved in cell wall biosynthesis